MIQPIMKGSPMEFDMSVEREVRARLFEMRDEWYKGFQGKLIPNVVPDCIIGVRTPRLRAYAREFGKDPGAWEFMKRLPHTYYEENNLHACLIEQIRDYDTLISALNEFLPYIDNWATCDMLRPKLLKKHRDRLLGQIKKWLLDEHPYTIRFGLEMLMLFYLDDFFQPEFLELAAQIDREEYYVRMMAAWFFATALASQYEAALPYLTQKRLPVWIHNKTIQKAVESSRISDDQKVLLRKLKIK